VILRRYIASHLVRGWLLALSVLVPVFGIIGFIQEMEHTIADYDWFAVARYTLLTLPQQAVSLSPVVALLGSMMALSGLYRSNELTIISCTGFPPARLVGAIALPTLVLMLLLWLGMEYVTPQLQQTAERQRYLLRNRTEIKLPDTGVWSMANNRFVRLGSVSRAGEPGDIDLFVFDESGRLLRAVHGESATVLKDRRWLLHDVREKRLVDGELVTSRRESLEMDNLWAPDELPTLSLSTESMALTVLYRYCGFLASNGQPMEKYLALFWQKTLLPVTLAAMVLLATPISAGVSSSRDRSVGRNLATGALIGILFYLAAQIIYALGHLLHMNLFLVALLPALMVFAVALVLIRRMRW